MKFMMLREIKFESLAAIPLFYILDTIVESQKHMNDEMHDTTRKS